MRLRDRATITSTTNQITQPVCMYFIWQNQFRLQIAVKRTEKSFLDSTEDRTGKN